MIAEVIVDIASSETDKIFDYIATEETKIGSRVRVPFGARHIVGFVVDLKDESSFSAQKIKSIEEVLDGVPAINEECMYLAKKIGKRYGVPMALSLRLFVPPQMRSGAVKEIFKKYYSVSDEPASFIKSAKAQQAAYLYIKEKGEVARDELLKTYSSAAIASLEKKGYICFNLKRSNRSPYKGESVLNAEKVLTAAQSAALESISTSAQTVQLLHGVTGSGKTEVYLSYIAKVLSQGKTAIFLVPEISLTPQMLLQLRARFGGDAAILHSGLSAGERFDEWSRLRLGEAKIAIGARSAVFAPLQNIGAIIIDEEHDSSYQSESAPRYSTFDIALIRAKYNGCKLILGSATPSIETYMRAKSGEFNLIKMPERINKKPLPQIIITDMRREVRRGNNTIFSAALKDNINDCLENGNQAILFLNRRGYSQSVICTECGYVAKCERCDIALTYHSEEGCLKCHYCGTKYHMLSACPECGGVKLNYFGTGTQRVSAELKKIFPKARILRMDNDTVSGKEGHYKILKQFARREADILIGTQMIAKGHDFPSVTLVGILDADMSLHFSDYRSSERTFQLITQVAGRSGRGKEKGTVVLQTYDPENNIIDFAVNYDYENFYRNEIAVRKATLFPPFALIVRVMAVSEKEEAAIEALRLVYTELEKICKANPDKVLFFAKMRSPIKRIQDKERFQVLMRLTDGALLSQIYSAAENAKSRDALVYVEENPANLG